MYANKDHLIAVVVFIVLIAVPIATGIYNDWKRSPRRRANHPSIRPIKRSEDES